MQLDFSTLAAADAYRWLASTVTPRPIAWVSTRSAAGVDNLAPFSFFQVICADPPTLMVNVEARRQGGHGEPKDTVRNVMENGQLVIHLVSAAQAEAMNASSATLAPEVSEFERCGIASVPSARVAPRRVRDAAVAFECELAELKPYPAERPRQFLIFARVLLAHVDDAVLADARHVDPARLDLVARLGGSLYATTRDRFAMKRPA